MTFAAPAGLLLALLAIPVIALHMLRPRRPPMVVSSTLLWHDVSSPSTAARPWQKLRPSTLLILQLAVIALLALVAARPSRTAPTALAQHTVFIVDASGSMAARDAKPDRLASARSGAMRLRGKLPAGGVASIVVASSQPHVVLTASGDKDAFADALRRIRTTASAADFASAFTLAESLETPGAPTGFVFLSDGGLTDIEKNLLPPGTQYVRVGSRATNRAISQLTVESRANGLHAHIQLRNTGGGAAKQQLDVDVDGRRATTLTVDLPAGATVERDIDLPAGERVEAFLVGDDLLGSDDHAVASATRAQQTRVQVSGPENIYLDRLLAALPDITVERTPEPRAGLGATLAIYDRVAVPKDPGVPFLAIAPPAGVSGVRVEGAVERPAVTLVQPDDSIVRGLDLSEVAIAESQRLVAPTARVVVGAEATPLLVRGALGERPFVYLGFALDRSNLPVQVAFPVLIQRVLAELAGPHLSADVLRVGQPLPLAPGAGTLESPTGVRATVEAAGLSPVADRLGFWLFHRDGRPDQVLAVNADPAESTLAPATTLPVEQAGSGGERRKQTEQSSLVAWFLVAVLAVLLAELIVSMQRRGVAPWQWRGAMVLRVVSVTLLVLALIGVTVPRSGRRVAVMFLVDASDSLGPSGRADAIAWAQQAIEKQPKSAVAGLAYFGGDARLDSTVQHDLKPSAGQVKVDVTQTDLANAVRLASAVLPSDAKRRIVIVSDGRANHGDATAEIENLRQQGIQVDVHVVSRPAGPDVAVARVDAPTRAHPGDALVLRATVVSMEAQKVHLQAYRGDSVVADKTVDVPAGSTVVELPVGTAPVGLTRYRVFVQGAADSIPENNTGYAAVNVEGPARVLVAEGVHGNAGTLVTALKAGGLQVDVKDSRDLPGIDQLSAYASTVLVDVDAQSLSATQLDALGSATRNLGRGLVAIGGDHSYALGGYLDSELEALLPVKSQVKDPKRKASVAEVLAIDTSGSMAACHCKPGAAGPNGMPQGGNIVQGGVDKTSISRSAAARAIAALGPNDQVGVMAFNTEQKFVIPLQKLPSQSTVTSGLEGLTPSGGTNLRSALEKAASALRAADTQLRHIILFSDGFTSTDALSQLESDAAKLRAEGITVSVLATGEGAAELLRGVAEQGGGRFYPGRNLEEIPQIMSEEAVIATRSFVNEGEFVPRVVSGAAPVRDLTSAPPLLGYLATETKTAASALLQVGPDDDPLLASWQVGLGRATAWTSDASARWSKHWAAWPGYVSFWSTVVKDTFAPSADAAGVTSHAAVNGDRLDISVEGTQPFADGTTATAKVVAPDATTREVKLDRRSPTSYVGTAPANQAGTYAVATEVRGADGKLSSLSASLASQSYPPEYQPGPAAVDSLRRISALSGGRGEIEPAAAFAAAGLPAGSGRHDLAVWMLVLAALLWPLDIALRRLALHGTGVAQVRTALSGVRSVPKRVVTAFGGRGRRRGVAGSAAAADVEAPVAGAAAVVAERQSRRRRRGAAIPDPEPQHVATLSELLDKRQRRAGDTGGDGSAGRGDRE